MNVSLGVFDVNKISIYLCVYQSFFFSLSVCVCVCVCVLVCIYVFMSGRMSGVNRGRGRVGLASLVSPEAR